MISMLHSSRLSIGFLFIGNAPRTGQAAFDLFNKLASIGGVMGSYRQFRAVSIPTICLSKKAGPRKSVWEASDTSLYHVGKFDDLQLHWLDRVIQRYKDWTREYPMPKSWQFKFPQRQSPLIYMALRKIGIFFARTQIQYKHKSNSDQIHPWKSKRRFYTIYIYRWKRLHHSLPAQGGAESGDETLFGSHSAFNQSL